MKNFMNVLGFGIVANDTEPGSWFADVFPVSQGYLYKGDISASTKHTKSVKDRLGNITNVEIESQPSIKCKWLALNTPNRATPPNLVKGQTVLLLNFNNIDEYFYVTIYSEFDIKKTEEISMVLSNKVSPNNVDDVMDATYRFSMSSIAKQICLKTSTTDGEFTNYELMIDTKEGKAYFLDGNKNLLYLNSETNDFLKCIINDHNSNIGNDKNALVSNNDNALINNNKTLIVKNDYNVSIEGKRLEAIESVDSFIAKDKYTEIGGEYGIYSKDGIVIESSGDIGVSSGTKDIKIFSGGGITIIAPKIDIASPVVNVSGVLTAGGLSMGAAPATDIKPPLAPVKKLDKETFSNIEENIINTTKNPLIEEEESSEEEEEKSDEENEERPKPQEPDTQPSSGDVSLTTDDNIIIKTNRGTITIDSTGNLDISGDMSINIKGNGKVKIDGSSGLDLAGGGTDIISVIDAFKNAVSLSLQGLSAVPGGSAIPVTFETAIKQYDTLKALFKGGV